MINATKNRIFSHVNSDSKMSVVEWQENEKKKKEEKQPSKRFRQYFQLDYLFDTVMIFGSDVKEQRIQLLWKFFRFFFCSFIFRFGYM